MAVGIVFVGIERERGGLHTAAGIDGACLGVLLRYESGGCQPPELQSRLDAEEGRGAAYQRRSGGHADVSRLDIAHYVVLRTLILKLEILRVEIEGGVGVVVEIEFHAVAHRRCHRGLYLLIEIKKGFAP